MCLFYYKSEADQKFQFCLFSRGYSESQLSEVRICWVI